MKTSIYFVFCIFCFSVHFLFAQTKEDRKKIRIADISVQCGMIILPTFNATLNDFQKIAPKSTILQKDFSHFTNRNSIDAQTNNILSMIVGIERGKNTKKAIAKFRCGFQYFNVEYLKSRLYNTESKPCDTLISTQTGNIYIIDSVKTQYCSMRYTSEQVHLDLSYIYQTNPNARFSGYVGIGASMGMSFNAQTIISYHEKISKESINYMAYSNTISSTENYAAKGNRSFWGYIPLGVDMRIIKKKPIWNKIHLYYETRPFININSIPNYGIGKGVGFQQGIAIKIAI